jgi:hypothetical protein
MGCGSFTRQDASKTIERYRVTASVLISLPALTAIVYLHASIRAPRGATLIRRCMPHGTLVFLTVSFLAIGMH